MPKWSKTLVTVKTISTLKFVVVVGKCPATLARPEPHRAVLVVAEEKVAVDGPGGCSEEEEAFRQVRLSRTDPSCHQVNEGAGSRRSSSTEDAARL